MEKRKYSDRAEYLKKQFKNAFSFVRTAKEIHAGLLQLPQAIEVEKRGELLETPMGNQQPSFCCAKEGSETIRKEYCFACEMGSASHPLRMMI